MANLSYFLYAVLTLELRCRLIFSPLDSNKELIAKKVREKSNELEILRLLNTVQPKSDHVISLLDWFHGQSRHCVILLAWTASRITLRLLLANLKAKSFKSAWASSRASHIFTSSVSHTGISSPTTLLSIRTFA
jgi:hypothetical protein